MIRRQYSVEMIISILNEIESGILAKDICRKYGFTEQTLYRWESK